jgi:hypothetical protein
VTIHITLMGVLAVIGGIAVAFVVGYVATLLWLLWRIGK